MNGIEVVKRSVVLRSCVRVRGPRTWFTNIAQLMSQQEENNKKLFGDRISALIKEKEITQAEVATRLDVTQGAVSGWCNGAVPRGDQLYRLALFFGVSMEWLMTGQGAKTPEEVLEMAVSFAYGKKKRPDMSDEQRESLLKAIREGELAKAKYKERSETSRAEKAEKELAEVKKTLRDLLKKLED